MRKCRICHQKTQLIMHFGKMPIANGFISDPTDKEFFFNLSLVFCPKCFMVQLGETVRPEMMFNDNYQFFSSTSSVMALHFEKQANHIMKIVSRKESPFIVELGSNDGIMLQHLTKNKIGHLGIEPAGNVAAIAEKKGVNVLKEFFTQETAIKILKKYGEADIICGSNVTCHIENLNSVAEGVKVLLKGDGIWFFEDPYIYDIIKKSSFDQIYDEHVYYFSGYSVANLARYHGMQLVDMRYQDVHGGSMRYYLKKGNKNKIAQRMKKYLSREHSINLEKLDGYLRFKSNVDKICNDLKRALLKIKKDGKRIVGYAATSKSTTLLNYAKIGPDIINYISDITPTKIGKYTPGTHISIRSHDFFIKDKPPYVLLLAWNHKKEIFQKEQEYRKKGGKFIIYFPKVVIE